MKTAKALVIGFALAMTLVSGSASFAQDAKVGEKKQYECSEINTAQDRLTADAAAAGRVAPGASQAGSASDVLPTAPAKDE